MISWPFLFPLDDKVLLPLAASNLCLSFSNQGLRSGSTGVAVFISGESLYIAWLGDSQVVLSKGGQAAQLMNPHKPDREVCIALLFLSELWPIIEIRVN